MAWVGEYAMTFQEKRLISGREFSEAELNQVRETVAMFRNLSQLELTYTLCEHLEWKAPNGQPKLHACKQLLKLLEESGEVVLPPKQLARLRGKDRAIEVGSRTDPPCERITEMAAVLPIKVEPVRSRSSMGLWNEYVERYHPLGYKRPFGAHERYFVWSREGAVLGCLLFAASAWALADRDKWIGWSEIDRSKRLHLVVNNTRFLILDWVSVPNLASKVLALVARRITGDWEERYGFAPVLLETFVDGALYRGTCYRAANWVYVGTTAGRGRMDRYSQYLSTPKLTFMYPLRPDFRTVLCVDSTDEVVER